MLADEKEQTYRLILGRNGFHLGSQKGILHKLSSILGDDNNNYSIINCKGKNGDTPLHLACSEGHSKVVRWLIMHKADIAIKNRDGETALHRASACGYDEIVNILIEHGADLNVKDEDGNAPIHRAAAWDHVQIISTLIGKQASADITNKIGNTPLHVAAYYGSISSVKQLICAHADTTVLNDENMNFMDYSNNEVLQKIYQEFLDIYQAHPRSLFTYESPNTSSHLHVAELTRKITMQIAEFYVVQERAKSLLEEELGQLAKEKIPRRIRKIEDFETDALFEKPSDINVQPMIHLLKKMDSNESILTSYDSESMELVPLEHVRRLSQRSMQFVQPLTVFPPVMDSKEINVAPNTVSAEILYEHLLSQTSQSSEVSHAVKQKNPKFPLHSNNDDANIAIAPSNVSMQVQGVSAPRLSVSSSGPDKALISPVAINVRHMDSFQSVDSPNPPRPSVVGSIPSGDFSSASLKPMPMSLNKMESADNTQLNGLQVGYVDTTSKNSGSKAVTATGKSGGDTAPFFESEMQNRMQSRSLSSDVSRLEVVTASSASINILPRASSLGLISYDDNNVNVAPSNVTMQVQGVSAPRLSVSSLSASSGPDKAHMSPVTINAEHMDSTKPPRPSLLGSSPSGDFSSASLKPMPMSLNKMESADNTQLNGLQVGSVDTTSKNSESKGFALIGSAAGKSGGDAMPFFESEILKRMQSESLSNALQQQNLSHSITQSSSLENGLTSIVPRTSNILLLATSDDIVVLPKGTTVALKGNFTPIIESDSIALIPPKHLKSPDRTLQLEAIQLQLNLLQLSGDDFILPSVDKRSLSEEAPLSGSLGKIKPTIQTSESRNFDSPPIPSSSQFKEDPYQNSPKKKYSYDSGEVVFGDYLSRVKPRKIPKPASSRKNSPQKYQSISPDKSKNILATSPEFTTNSTEVLLYTENPLLKSASPQKSSPSQITTSKNNINKVSTPILAKSSAYKLKSGSLSNSPKIYSSNTNISGLASNGKANERKLLGIVRTPLVTNIAFGAVDEKVRKSLPPPRAITSPTIGASPRSGTSQKDSFSSDTQSPLKMNIQQSSVSPMKRTVESTAGVGRVRRITKIEFPVNFKPKATLARSKESLGTSPNDEISPRWNAQLKTSPSLTTEMPMSITSASKLNNTPIISSPLPNFANVKAKVNTCNKTRYTNDPKFNSSEEKIRVHKNLITPSSIKETKMKEIQQHESRRAASLPFHSSLVAEASPTPTHLSSSPIKVVSSSWRIGFNRNVPPKVVVPKYTPLHPSNIKIPTYKLDYKNVKSKLFEPTKCSMHHRWQATAAIKAKSESEFYAGYRLNSSYTGEISKTTAPLPPANHSKDIDQAVVDSERHEEHIAEKARKRLQKYKGKIRSKSLSPPTIEYNILPLYERRHSSDLPPVKRMYSMEVQYSDDNHSDFDHPVPHRSKSRSSTFDHDCDWWDTPV